MENLKTIYKRHLPHYHFPNEILFITFRLANSLPEKVIYELKNEQLKEEKIILGMKVSDSKLKELIYNSKKIYFNKFDCILNINTYGPKWLQIEQIANIIKEAIHYRDKKEYNLFSYCIMPNHVHVVLENNNQNKSFYRVMQSLKRYTARKSNEVLGISDKPFWHHESYDHIVRDERELERIIKYIIYNPVKAGLVNNIKDWKYNFNIYDIY